MSMNCPRCGHSLADDARVCSRCAHDLLDRSSEGRTLLSTLWLIVRSVALLGAATVGVPVGGRGLPERSLPQGRWRWVMITGKVVAVAGCLWAVIAVYTAHSTQLWMAVPVVAVGFAVALVGRTSPRWSRG